MLNTFIVRVPFLLLKQVSRWLLLGSLTEIYDLSMNKGHGCLLSSLLLLIFHYGAGNKGTECVGAGGVPLGLNGRLKTMRNSAKRLSGEQTLRAEEVSDGKSPGDSCIREMGKEASRVTEGSRTGSWGQGCR